MEKDTNIRVLRKSSKLLTKLANKEGRNKKKMFEIIVAKYAKEITI